MSKLDILIKDDCISADDMGFLYGFCLFETFLMDRHYKIFLLERHIDRMLNSVNYFKIDIGVETDKFKAIIKHHIDENKSDNTIFRVTLSAGNKHKGISPSLSFSKRENTYTPEKIAEGCSLHLSEVRKSESSVILQHKTSNYLENYVLLQEALGNGFDDVLFSNSKEQITETSKSNIFFVKSGTLYTPDMSCGLLPGIIRGWIIERANYYGVNCIQGVFHIEDLLNADEVFVTNSVFGIMHVKCIENKTIGVGKAGEKTKLFSKELF